MFRTESKSKQEKQSECGNTHLPKGVVKSDEVLILTGRQSRSTFQKDQEGLCWRAISSVLGHLLVEEGERQESHTDSGSWHNSQGSGSSERYRIHKALPKVRNICWREETLPWSKEFGREPQGFIHTLSSATPEQDVQWLQPSVAGAPGSDPPQRAHWLTQL